MRLKRPEDVQWAELPKVESPEIARAWAESNLPLSGYELCWVQGLEDVIWDELSQQLHVWDNDSRGLLLDRLGNAEVFLVHGLSSEPLRPAVRRGEGEQSGTWVVDPSLTLVAQLNVHKMVDYAADTKGIWAPILKRTETAAQAQPKTKSEPESLTVTNPRWEHVDQQRGKDSPDAAAGGDLVRLMVDVTGASNGAVVTFRVFDASISPAGRVAAVRGEVQDGIGTAEWEIKRDRQGAKLEFEGMVRRVGSERAEIPFDKPSLRLGIFFDGTGNDMNSPDTYSNVAKLYQAYKADDETVFALYKRGVGTDGGILDDVDGKAFGAGAEARVEGMLWEMKEAMDTYRKGAGGGELPDTIVLDVFGFSRGAATARLFVNVLKQQAYTFDAPYEELTPDKFSLHFLGLFDTVGSFGYPGNDTDPGKCFVIEPKWVEGKVVHLVADDEYRENFDLQSLFDSQTDVPCDMERGPLCERIVPGAHSDVGGGYSSGQEHGCNGNQLGRIHLHRMHKEALEQEVPITALEELQAKRPQHWEFDTQAGATYDKLMQAYETHSGLQKDHKKVRELQRGLEWAEYMLDTLPQRRLASPADAARLLEYRELNHRIEDLEKRLQEQRDTVAGHFASPDAAQDFFGTHEKLHMHVHHSHAPINTTTGMGPEVQDDGTLRREVFYKPFVSLKEIPWWAMVHPALMLLVKVNYEPRKFDD